MGTASLFSKTTAVGHTWPMTSLSMSLWPGLQHQEQTPSHEANLQSSSEAVGYSPNRHTAIALEGTHTALYW